MWTLQPSQEARSLLGEERTNIDDPREYIWVGDGTFLMHNVLSNGQLVQFVLTGHDHQEVDGKNWRRTVSAEMLRELYRSSLPHLKYAVDKVRTKDHRSFLPFLSFCFITFIVLKASTVTQLLCQQPEQPALYLWDHPRAKTYVSGPICIM